MKHFPNPQVKAAAYAAHKELERMLKADGELPPGSNYDVSGFTIEIKLQSGISITRDKGVNEDGRIQKTATQNLYGYAVLAQCFRIARLFNHHKKLERLLLKIVRKALKSCTSSEEAVKQLMPAQLEAIEKLKQELDIPKRDEPTPRNVERANSKHFPTITVHPNKRKAG